MAFGAFYSLLPIRYSLVAVALVAATGAALAQTWPQRPVKVLVPFAAGGNIDVMGRLAASRMSEAFGQQFVGEHLRHRHLSCDLQGWLRPGQGSGAHQPVRRGAAGADRKPEIAGADRSG